MGGSLSVEDETGHGATFLLPRLLDADPVDWPVVRECILTCPDQCRMYCHGAEPSLLLRAIRRSAPVGVIELLDINDEDAKDQISPASETILHAAANDPELVRYFLKRCPEQASMSDDLGRLPLHRSTNVEAARRLIDVYPKALRHRSGKFGRLALHEALLQDRIDPDLVRTLSRESGLETRASGCVMSRDKRGRTPFRLLLDSLEREFVDEQWNVLHEWICRQWHTGPDLHVHIEHGGTKSLRMMEKALKAFPNQIVERDKFGRTPLHVAAFNGQCDADALEALIRENPRAPRMTGQ